MSPGRSHLVLPLPSHLEILSQRDLPPGPPRKLGFSRLCRRAPWHTCHRYRVLVLMTHNFHIMKRQDLRFSRSELRHGAHPNRDTEIPPRPPRSRSGPARATPPLLQKPPGWDFRHHELVSPVPGRHAKVITGFPSRRLPPLSTVLGFSHASLLSALLCGDTSRRVRPRPDGPWAISRVRRCCLKRPRAPVVGVLRTLVPISLG